MDKLVRPKKLAFMTLAALALALDQCERKVWQRLKASGRKVELVIGRMRPIDRDDQLPRLQVVKAGAPRPVGAEPLFVVTTQCIEVGADLDFDVLVTENAVCFELDTRRLCQRRFRLQRESDFCFSIFKLNIINDTDFDAGHFYDAFFN